MTTFVSANRDSGFEAAAEISLAHMDAAIAQVRDPHAVECSSQRNTPGSCDCAPEVADDDGPHCDYSFGTDATDALHERRRS